VCMKMMGLFEKKWNMNSLFLKRLIAHATLYRDKRKHHRIMQSKTRQRLHAESRDTKESSASCFVNLLETVFK
jgi:hypothetical protein